jgi:Flp pilus assembly protein TadG
MVEGFAMIIGHSPIGCLFRGSRSLNRLFTRVVEDKRGVAAIEFGIMIPLFGLMLVSVTDIGLSVYRKMQVEGAAQAGAQYAMFHGFDTSSISAAVTSASNAAGIAATPAPTQFCGCLNASGISTVACGTTCPGGAMAGTYTTVSAQASYATIFSYQVVPATYTHSAQSTVRLK